MCKLQMAIDDVRGDLELYKEELARRAQLLSERMVVVQRYLKDRGVINGLGEVQLMGTSVDVLCGKVNVLQNLLKNMEALT